jgi:hypothetical protein
MNDSMHNTIRYQLWRQDDNGNVFLIQESDSKQELERERARLEAGGHKQIYWIRQMASAIHD